MIATLLAQFHRFSAPSGRSVNERIFAAALTVGTLATIVRVLGAAKVMVIANHFGTGDEFDAFLVAFLLPSFMAEVLAGAFSAALIPAFIEVRDAEGSGKANELLAGILYWTIRLLLLASIVLAFLSHGIVHLLGLGFSESKLHLAQVLFRVLLPVFILSGISATWRAVLNAGEKFALPALVPGMTPLLTIVLLFVFDRQFGAYTMAGAAVAGTLLEVILLGHRMRRQGFSLLPRRAVNGAQLRMVGEQYAPLLAGALISGGSVIIDQAMAASLGPGSVSVLSYGIKMVTVVLAIGTTAISTAVLPHFAGMTARRDWEGVRKTLWFHLATVLKVSAPVIIALIFFTEPIVGFLYQRGAFTEADTQVVANVQACSLLQVPICLAGVLIVRVISAFKANHILLGGAVMNLVANVALNLLLMRWWGVAGIAISTTLANLLTYSYLFVRMRRLMDRAS